MNDNEQRKMLYGYLSQKGIYNDEQKFNDEMDSEEGRRGLWEKMSKGGSPMSWEEFDENIKPVLKNSADKERVAAAEVAAAGNVGKENYVGEDVKVEKSAAVAQGGGQAKVNAQVNAQNSGQVNGQPVAARTGGSVAGEAGGTGQADNGQQGAGNAQPVAERTEGTEGDTSQEDGRGRMVELSDGTQVQSGVMSDEKYRNREEVRNWSKKKVYPMMDTMIGEAKAEADAAGRRIVEEQGGLTGIGGAIRQEISDRRINDPRYVKDAIYRMIGISNAGTDHLSKEEKDQWLKDHGVVKVSSGKDGEVVYTYSDGSKKSKEQAEKEAWLKDNDVQVIKGDDGQLWYKYRKTGVVRKVSNGVEDSRFMQELSDMAWKQVGLDKNRAEKDDAQPRLAGNRGEEQEPEMSEEEMEGYRKRYSERFGQIVGEVQEDIRDRLKMEYMPVNELDYVFWGGLRDQITGRMVDALLDKAAGSSQLRAQLRAEAESDYLKGFGGLAAATMGGMRGALSMMDPAFGVSGMGGRLIGKGIGYGVGAIIAKAGGKTLGKAAVKYLPSVVSSGWTFGNYDLMGGAIQQYADGKWDAGELVGSWLEGAKTGAVIGSMNGVTKGVADGMAKRWQKGVTHGVGFGAELGYFSGAEWKGVVDAELAKKYGQEEMDKWSNEEYMQKFGEQSSEMGIGEGAKVVGKQIVMLGILKAKGHHEEEARRLEQIQGMFTPEQRAELQPYMKMITSKKPVDKKSLELNREAKEAGLDVAEDVSGEERLAEYKKFMEDKNVSAKAKQLVTYMMFGERVDLNPVMRVEMPAADENGVINVISYDAEGNLIEKKSFRDINRATEEWMRTDHERQLNQIKVNEDGLAEVTSRLSAAMQQVMKEENMSEERIAGIMNGTEGMVDGQRAGWAQKIVERVNEVAKQMTIDEGIQTIADIRQQVLDETGVDVDEAMGSRFVDRKKKEAINKYEEKLEGALKGMKEKNDRVAEELRIEEEAMKIVEAESDKMKPYVDPNGNVIKAKIGNNEVYLSEYDPNSEFCYYYDENGQVQREKWENVEDISDAVSYEGYMNNFRENVLKRARKAAESRAKYGVDIPVEFVQGQTIEADAAGGKMMVKGYDADGNVIVEKIEDDIKNGGYRVLDTMVVPEDQLKEQMVNAKRVKAEAAKQTAEKGIEVKPEEVVKQEEEQKKQKEEAAKIEQAKNNAMKVEGMVIEGMSGDKSVKIEVLGVDENSGMCRVRISKEGETAVEQEQPVENVLFVAKSGQVSYKVQGGLVRNEMSDNMNSFEVKKIDAIGSQIGKRIVLVSGKDMERLQGDRAALGSWDENGTIYANIDALNGADRVVRYVLGHEVTHVLKAENGADVWNGYVESVKKYMGDRFQSEFDRIKSLYAERLQAMGKRMISDDEVVEEVVANWAAEHTLNDSEFARELLKDAEMRGQGESMYRRIMNWIEDMISKVSGKTYRKPEDEEQLKALNEARNMWMKMYDEVRKGVNGEKENAQPVAERTEGEVAGEAAGGGEESPAAEQQGTGLREEQQGEGNGQPVAARTEGGAYDRIPERVNEKTGKVEKVYEEAKVEDTRAALMERFGGGMADELVAEVANSKIEEAKGRMKSESDVDEKAKAYRSMKYWEAVRDYDMQQKEVEAQAAKVEEAKKVVDGVVKQVEDNYVKEPKTFDEVERMVKDAIAGVEDEETRKKVEEYWNEKADGMYDEYGKKYWNQTIADKAADMGSVKDVLDSMSADEVESMLLDLGVDTNFDLGMQGDAKSFKNTKIYKRMVAEDRSDIGKVIDEVAEENRKKRDEWREKQAYGFSDEAQVKRNNAGEIVEVKGDDGSVKYSLTTYDEDVDGRGSGRKRFHEYLAKQVKKGVLDEDMADEMARIMEEQYEEAKRLADSGEYPAFADWSLAPVKKDKWGNVLYSVVKSNGEYGMNLDFSLVCKKRRPLDATLNLMVARGLVESMTSGNDDLSIAKINDILRSHGFETACKLCFVDAKRFRQAKIADDFVNLYNGLVNRLVPRGSRIKVKEFGFGRKGEEDNGQPVAARTGGGEWLDEMNEAVLENGIERLKQISEQEKNGVKGKIARHLLAHPEDRKFVKRSDFMSSVGFDAVAAENPEIMKLYNSKKGSGGAKVAESDVQYLNDVSQRGWRPDAAYKVGGVRIQSFSDFVPHMIFDYLQMFADLAAGKLPAHSYTKEKFYVWAFGRTGVKINMSLVPKVVKGGIAAGLDKDGNYAWQEGETFDYDDAVAIQNTEGYRENCGTIAVGISDEHIRKMMADPNIRMIIPYHKSGINKKIAVHNNIDKFTDYTNSQNTRYSTGKKIDKKDAAKEKSFEEYLEMTGDPKKAAEAYINDCNKKGWMPKFSQFLEKTANGYKYVDGYYKLLEDFVTYVPNEEGGFDYYPQREVRMDYPKAGDAFGGLEDIMRMSLREDSDLAVKMEKEVAPVVDEIERELGLKGNAQPVAERTGEEDNVRYMLVEDPEEIDRLEKEKKVKVYRAMQVIDGKLYPPMSAKVDGKMRSAVELGKWERSEERPDLVDENGNFKLNKGNKKSVVPAKYNPYFHTSLTPLNDQFSEAQDRPNLVVVEVEVPESELSSGYRAENAKDAVGRVEWKAGIIQSQLSGTRSVILSRWDKPVRIVPDSEIADVVMGMFDGKKVVMPSNVVTPTLREEMERRGVQFVETDNRGKILEGKYKGMHYSRVYGKNGIETLKPDPDDPNGGGGKKADGAVEGDTSPAAEMPVRGENEGWVDYAERLDRWNREQEGKAKYMLDEDGSEKKVEEFYNQGSDFEYKDENGSIKTMKIHANMNQVRALNPETIELKEYSSREEAREDYNRLGYGVNKKTGEKVRFYGSAFKKNHRQDGIFEKVIPYLKDLYESSILAYSQPENLSGEKREDGTIHPEHRDTINYGNYLNRFRIKDGREYYIRMTIQRKKNDSGVHSNFITNVDVYENPTAVAYEKSHGQGRLDNDRISDAKLKKFFEIASENERKVLFSSKKFKDWFGDWENDPENASKVVDKNGEPMVVEHGTPWGGFDEFKLEDGGFHFVTDAHEYAYDYAHKRDVFYDPEQGGEETNPMWNPEIKRLFADIKNPLDVGELSEMFTDEQVGKIADALGISVDEFKDKFVEDWMTTGYEVVNNKKFADFVAGKGFDGIKAREWDKYDTWGVLESNQLKSADENNGEFDKNNPNIKYMLDEDSPANIGREQEEIDREREKKVRSANFKRWFGDWEKDPENASKVVDEEGKPMVMYHGSGNYGFTIFDTGLERDKDKSNVGSHFGDKGTADEFGDEDSMYAVYLDIKKPFETFDFFADIFDNAYMDVLNVLSSEIGTKEADKMLDKIMEIYPEIDPADFEAAKEEGFLNVFGDDEGLVNDTKDGYSEKRNKLVDLLRDMLKLGGYDGMRYQNWYEGDGKQDCWVVLDPEQVKSASVGDEMENSGKFDRKNKDIRYMFAGEEGMGRDGFDSNQMARRMELEMLEKSGKEDLSDEEKLRIKMATGWERGKDQQWRYEVDDFNVDKRVWNTWAMIENGAGLPLGSLFDQNWMKDKAGLLDMYPVLRNVPVYVDRNMKHNAATYKYVDEGDRGYKYKIAINPTDLEEIRRVIEEEESDLNDLKMGKKHGKDLNYAFLYWDDITDAKAEAELKRHIEGNKEMEEYMHERFNKSLAHEVQHVIQWEEGFDDGSSVGAIGSKLYREKAGEVEARNTARRYGMSENDRRSTLASDTEDVSRDEQWRSGDEGVGEAAGESRYMLDEGDTSLGGKKRSKAEWKKVDEEYMKAVEDGDMERAQEIINEVAKERGYDSDNSWRMMHKAPDSNYPEYGLTSEDSPVPSDYWDHPEWYATGYEERESMYIIRHALDRFKKRVADGMSREEAARKTCITIYRGVDKQANKREGRMRAGDWVTPSRSYAVGQNNENGTRVIEERVRLSDLYFDGNSPAELGWDDGRSYAYKDTKNNRKLLDVVTRDNDGNIIPPSQRFNSREYEVRWMLDDSPANNGREQDRKRREDVDEMGFYSPAERAVRGVKQEKGTGEQWLKMIEKVGGLKKEEDKWMGLSDWLRGKKGVTKDEVLEYIRENSLEMREVRYEEGKYNKEFLNLVKEMGAEEAWDKMVEKYGEEFEKSFDKDMSIGEEWLYIGDDGSVMPNDIDNIRLDYTTEGLKDKKEIALVMPDIEAYNENDNIHFGDAGEGRAVAWCRFGDYVDGDGKRVLVIDEIQSKRHQDGRERGYKDRKYDEMYYSREIDKVNEEIINLRNRVRQAHGIKNLMVKEMVDVMDANEKAEYDKLIDKKKDLQAKRDAVGDVPDAPFQKNWHELVMKRMLRYAAENGYDRVAWTDGRTQSKRYGLSSVLDKVYVLPNEDNAELRDVLLYKKDAVGGFGNEPSINCVVDREGMIVKCTKDDFKGHNLAEVVGKEMADKFMSADLDAKDEYYFPMDEIEVGGEGMSGFYDQMLPRWMNKYGKKWGVQVEKMFFEGLRDRSSGYEAESEDGRKGLEMWSVPVSEEMRRSVMEEGQSRYMLSDGGVGDTSREDGSGRRKRKRGAVDVGRMSVEKRGRRLLEDGALDWQDHVLISMGGGAKFRWEDSDGSRGLGAESTGRSSEKDRKILKKAGMIDERNGETPDEMAHRIWESMPEEMQTQCDVQQIKDEILENVRSYGDHKSMLEAAEKVHFDNEKDELKRYEEEAKERYAKEQGYESYEALVKAERDSYAHQQGYDDYDHMMQVRKDMWAQNNGYNDYAQYEQQMAAQNAATAEIARQKAERERKYDERLIQNRIEAARDKRFRTEYLEKEAQERWLAEKGYESMEDYYASKRLAAEAARKRQRLTEKKKAELEEKMAEYEGEFEYNADGMPEAPEYSRSGSLDEYLDKMDKYNEVLRLWSELHPEHAKAHEESRRIVQRAVNKALSSDSVGDMGKRELNKIMTAVRTAKADNLSDVVQDALRAVNKVVVRSQQEKIDKLLKMKVQDMNGKNMSIAKNVDDATRRIVEKLREFANGDHDLEGTKEAIDKLYDKMDNHVKRLSEAAAEGDTSRAAEDPTGENTWTEEDSETLAALQVVQRMDEGKATQRDLDGIEDQLAKAKQQLDDLSATWADGEFAGSREQYMAKRRYWRNRIKALNQKASSVSHQRIQEQESLLNDLSELIEGGKNSLKDKVENEQARRLSLLNGAFGDINGSGKRVNVQEAGQYLHEKWYKKIFTAALSSFEYMAQSINTRGLGRDGYIYRYFVSGKDGVVEANNVYSQNMRANIKTLDNKCEEIYGKGKTFAKVTEQNEKVVQHTGIYVSDPNDPDHPEALYEMAMSKGQATYAYMVWKMKDGQAQLRLQGFSDQTIDEIKDFIGEQNVQWADWVQKELLGELRERYNDKYVEMYNTSLAEVENYVPLKRVKEMTRQDSDLSGNSRQQSHSLVEKAGSLINRRNNDVPVALTNSAFDVVFEHINQMEEWNAFAKVRKDLDYLLGSAYFRNQMNRNSKGAFERFEKAAEIAAHAERRTGGSNMDEVIATIQKGLVGAPIAYRNTTALKQMLSVPAFLGYSQDPRFVAAFLKNVIGQYGGNAPAIIGNMVTFGTFGKRMFKNRADMEGRFRGAMTETIGWCMNNVPDYYDRVNKMHGGDSSLDDTLTSKIGKIIDKYLEQGMISNQMVDAVTCAIGIKTIYDFKMARVKDMLKKMDLTPEARKSIMEEEHRKAVMEATIYYNGTQQSNHKAFLSPMQVSKTMGDRMMSVYQNASIGFARRFVTALQDMKRLGDWDKQVRHYTRRLMENANALGNMPAGEAAGKRLTEEQARTMAQKYLRRELRHKVVEAGMYGFLMNFIWDLGGKGLLGLFRDDDNEEDKIMGMISDPKFLTTLPARGTTGMNIIGNVVNQKEVSNILLNEIGTMVQDYKNINEKYGVVSPEMAWFVMNHGGKMIGWDPKVWANTYIGFEDMVMDGNWKDGDRRIIDLMYLMNSPESNRKQVAKELYKDRPVEEYMEAVKKAARYVAEGNSYEGWFVGMKSIKEAEEKKLIKEFYEKNASPEEKQAMKEKQEFEDRLKMADLEDMDKMLETETDEGRREKILNRYHRVNKDVHQSGEERAEAVKQELIGKEESTKGDGEKFWIQSMKGNDAMRESNIKRKQAEDKKYWDAYRKLEKEGKDDEAEKYYEKYGHRIDAYEYRKDLMSEVREILNDMDDMDEGERKAAVKNIRKIEVEVLRK